MELQQNSTYPEAANYPEPGYPERQLSVSPWPFQ